ncbi:MAG: protein O-mannosyl-transferase TMTC1-related protein [Rhodospirillaceae bacterium]
MPQGKPKRADSTRTPRMPAPRPAMGWPAAAGILALVCLAAYWNSFRAGFLLDNQTIILNDPRLRAADWQHVRDIFTHHYWWPSLESHLYRPLTTLTYWFNYSVLGNGGRPFGYHAVNLLLHWMNATLVFALVRGITRRHWPALATACVFAVHPLTVEAVTNIVGRADLLAGLSVLGGVLCYRRFLAAVPGRRAMWLAGLGAAYLAGVFCKESAVILPGVMLLHDLAFLPGRAGTARATVRSSFARVWPAYLSVAPGAIALWWARWHMFRDSPLFGQFASDNPIVIAPFWTGVMTAVKVTGYYLALLVWPAKLSCDYSYDAITLFGGTLASGQDPHAWAALAAIILLGAAAVAAWRRDRAVWFFMGLAAVAYLPTSNLLVVIGTVMAERLMYLPLAGAVPAAVLAFAALGARAFARAPDRLRRGAGVAWAAAALAVIAALTVRTVQRNEDWASAQRLWSSSAQAAPGSIKVYRALAALAMESDSSGGRADEAIALATQGLRILEASPLPLPHRPAALYEELGVYYAGKYRLMAGRGEPERARAALGEAVTLLRRAEEIDREINRLGRERLLRRGLRPDEVADTGTPGIYKNLGWALLEIGDAEQAAATLSYLVHIKPGDFDAHYMLGVAEGGASEWERARGNQQGASVHLARAAVSLIEATLLNPGHDPSWQTLARVYSLLVPSPPAVLNSGGGRSLNMDHPLVPGHFREACVELVRQLAEAGLRDDAERWRRRLIDEFGMPPGLFVPDPRRKPESR